MAEKVNNASHKTGVTASVDGDALTFRSVHYGTKATAAVSVSSGDFAVTGGNEDGTANGTNAVAEINGFLLAGDTPAANADLRHRETGESIAHDATIKLTGHLGSATFTIDTVGAYQRHARHVGRGDQRQNRRHRHPRLGRPVRSRA